MDQILAIREQAYTVRNGARKNHAAEMLIAVLVAIVVGLAVFAFFVLISEPVAAPTTPWADSETPSRSEGLTKAKYDQLQIGMSYQDTVRIIGVGGEELSRNRIDGVPGVMESIETVMYMWQNADGSNMNAVFQNGKLIQKAQFGLR